MANMVQQIFEGKLMKEQGTFSLWMVLFVMSVGGALVLSFISLRLLIVLFAIVLVGFPALAYGMYQTGTVMNIVYPETAWIFVGMASLWYRNKTELRAKREIKKAFAHYVSPVVVNELVKNPDSLKLGGKRQQISVMFSDIVGFTTLAEKLSPEDTVALLNDYLTAMTEVVFSYHGTLDKYQGDAIMALYSAPLDDPHHAVNACSTALGMRMALVTLHEKWNSIPQLPMKDKLIGLDFRVGIATGPAVIGNVGSEKRFDYTAIGDIVNLGSRLESINRKYGTRVIVDKGTFTSVTENHNPFIFRKLDTVRVKGKEKETEIFEVVGFAENATVETKAMLDDFENGRILYTQRNFIEAKQYFEAALARVKDDGPSQIYRNRCNFYLRKPPGREWSPVVNLEEK
jgi:adenylate cyclase